ncbi:hypothetical protein PF001_g32022 [Phytophthora fragariae]|uniref:Uncharacterized protein n=1 Tax=Phytophthora fragariae TaxID=53985 RepID=A0A6A4AWS4_9STRA|nr:hypothetical protein PF001_g32022 [Phytophthora fragariae]
MIGTDTGGSSCVSQEHNRTCTATEKISRRDSGRGDLDDDHELEQHGDDHGHEHLDGRDSAKRGHTRAAGSITAERGGSRAEAMGPVRLVGR